MKKIVPPTAKGGKQQPPKGNSKQKAGRHRSTKRRVGTDAKAIKVDADNLDHARLADAADQPKRRGAAADLREQLYNGGEVGPVAQVQLSEAEVTSLRAV